jgi:hypothetical protein
MMNPAQIREAIASGEAVLRYIKYEETWYYEASRVPRDDWITSELSVGVDAPDGGTYGEWTIMVGDLGLGSQPAAQHRIFDDSIAAMLAVPDYWQVMEAAGDNPDAVEHALIALGFIDKTERINPYAKSGVS